MIETGRDKAVARVEIKQRRALDRMPFALQTRVPGEDWVTLAKATKLDRDGLLLMMAGNRPELERRILHRNTVHACWAAGERAGQQ